MNLQSAKGSTWTSEVVPALPAPRPTPTQAFRELAMAVAQRSSSPENSVTISRNARGVFQFEVTVRGEDVTDCIAEAKDTVAELVELYPYPATNGSTE
jgi:hypothetical protein